MTEESRGVSAVTPAYLQQCVVAERQEIERRKWLYRGGASFPPIAGQTVILVDDGLATGATFEAAILALRELKPSRLIGAVPVAPPETVTRLRALLVELVVLEVPEHFLAVGEAYQDFRQLEDEEVVRLLEDARGHFRRI